MDLVFALLIVAFVLGAIGLAVGCARLQPPRAPR